MHAELKRDGETWDGFFRRAADAVDGDESDDAQASVPRCTDCGNKAQEWTVEDGMLVCGLCATEGFGY